MTHSGDALAPGTRLEEFRIERVRGAGGFGVTYLARDVDLLRLVAVKEYLPHDWASRLPGGGVGPRSTAHDKDYRWGLERFLDEARILANLEHPHVVRVHRVIKGNGTAYMVMEYVEGRSLAEELEAGGRLSEARVRALLEALTSGLETVHAAGLAHRDIKPSNVMLRSDGSPVLIDFGAARQVVGRQSRSLTSVLTPGYAPIEQYSTEGRQGPWTDVYALAAVAYEALSGRVPNEAPARVRKDPLSPLRVAAASVSAVFAAAVDSALSVHAEDRPRSVSSWRAMWSEASADVKPSTPRMTYGVAAAVALLAVATGFAGWWMGRGGSPDVAVSDAGVSGTGLVAPLSPGPGSAPDAVPPSGPETGPETGQMEPGAPASTLVPAASLDPEPSPVDTAPSPPGAERVPSPESIEVAPDRAGRLAALRQPGRVFRDECAGCPEMVVVPSGSFMMGAPDEDEERMSYEDPRHRVTISSPFAVGVYEVTFAEWDACVADGGCGGYRPDDEGWGRGSWPVINVSWEDAQSYVRWLSRETGAAYRLLSESEWEYVVRGGTATRYWWGDSAGWNSAGWNQANCYGCGTRGVQTFPVGSFAANDFGVYDVAGNVWEWVEDCWHDGYAGAPSDGSAWASGGDCGERVVRGGSFSEREWRLRSSHRESRSAGNRDEYTGIRVSRALD